LNVVGFVTKSEGELKKYERELVLH
jgi:hypothetical protein